MIGSRIHTRYQIENITVKAKAISGGQNVESSALTSLKARRVPIDAGEQISDAGLVVIATDIFWFEPLPGGTLPAITENHVLVDSGSVRYEIVMRPTNQAGGGKRLKVVTRRLS